MHPNNYLWLDTDNLHKLPTVWKGETKKTTKKCEKEWEVNRSEKNTDWVKSRVWSCRAWSSSLECMLQADIIPRKECCLAEHMHCPLSASSAVSCEVDVNRPSLCPHVMCIICRWLWSAQCSSFAPFVIRVNRRQMAASSQPKTLSLLINCPNKNMPLL